jgi:hypothetical protein
LTIQREPDRIVRGKPGPISRRAFLGLTGMSAALVFADGLMTRGPLHAFGVQVAVGQTPG